MHDGVAQSDFQQLGASSSSCFSPTDNIENMQGRSNDNLAGTDMTRQHIKQPLNMINNNRTQVGVTKPQKPILIPPILKIIALVSNNSLKRETFNLASVISADLVNSRNYFTFSYCRLCSQSAFLSLIKGVDL